MIKHGSQAVGRESGFPERQLWCAVLERALQDAVGRGAGQIRDESRRREQRDALQWFVDNGRDYQLACDAAGIDAEQLRQRVLTLAAEAAQTPIEEAAD